MLLVFRDQMNSFSAREVNYTSNISRVDLQYTGKLNILPWIGLANIEAVSETSITS